MRQRRGLAAGGCPTSFPHPLTPFQPVERRTGNFSLVYFSQLDLGRRDEPCRQNEVLIWSTGFVATILAGHMETLAGF